MSGAAERIVALYESNAAAFDAQRDKSLFEKPWLERFCALVRPGGEALDLGCGSGEPVASYLIGAGLRVTGVDASPQMIALCAARFPAQSWRAADMRGLDLGRAFDGILAWDSFFHLTADAQQAMFPVFARHAAPHAPLIFTSGPARGEAIGSWQGEPLYHASLDPADYRALLDAQGFDVLRHVAEDPSCGDRTIWLARKRGD